MAIFPTIQPNMYKLSVIIFLMMFHMMEMLIISLSQHFYLTMYTMYVYQWFESNIIHNMIVTIFCF